MTRVPPQLLFGAKQFRITKFVNLCYVFPYEPNQFGSRDAPLARKTVAVRDEANLRGEEFFSPNGRKPIDIARLENLNAPKWAQF
jgi:hypothetical protein